MRKSPWAILVIGVLGIVALLFVSRFYTGFSKVVLLREALSSEFGLEEVTATVNGESGAVTITYVASPAAFKDKNKGALEEQMDTIAKFAKSKYSFKHVIVTAKGAGETTHTKQYQLE